jgi:signal transduction histidine kinase
MIEKRTSELKGALKDLQNTQSQLIQSEKMASIGQLAAGVAHEINNPTGFISSNLLTLAEYEKDIRSLFFHYKELISNLKAVMAAEKGLNSIAGKLETIEAFEEEVDIDFIFDDFPNLVKECSEGSERIKKIVIDLKNFAHPGEDKQKFADINRNLDSTLNVVRNEIKYKASVKKDYGDLPEVLCHPQQLNQVFMNLFVNAAQAIEKDGEIKVQTRAANGFVEIRISDTGVGIPKENISKIFDPFFTTKDVGKGTGLGLNVSYNIIKEHNGTIEVDSTVGQGTIFTVRIPVQLIDKEE